MLSTLADARTARPWLEATLGTPIDSVSVLHVTPREDWSVQFEASIDGRQVRLAAQHLAGPGLEKAYARLARRGNGLVAARPDLEVLVFPFPLDPRLEHLSEAADAAVVAPHLGLEGGGEAVPLRYLPSRRCVFRYTFRDRRGSPSLFLGKLFRDQRGERLAGVTNRVADAFSAFGDPRLTAPRAIAWLPELCLLVQEWLPGSTLYGLIQDGTALGQHIVTAARAIAVLHGSAPAVEKRYGIEDELDLIGGAALPPGPAAELAGVLRGLASYLCVSRLVPVHRDYYDKQLLVDGPRTALIDLDTLALGPAEIDLANFVAHLHLREFQGALPQAVARIWEAVFLREYEHRRPHATDPRLFEFFLATACLRLASLYRTRPHAAAVVPRLLELSCEAARRAGARLAFDTSASARSAK